MRRRLHFHLLSLVYSSWPPRRQPSPFSIAFSSCVPSRSRSFSTSLSEYRSFVSEKRRKGCANLYKQETFLYSLVGGRNRILALFWLSSKRLPLWINPQIGHTAGCGQGESRDGAWFLAKDRAEDTQCMGRDAETTPFSGPFPNMARSGESCADRNPVPEEKHDQPAVRKKSVYSSDMLFLAVCLHSGTPPTH